METIYTVIVVSVLVLAILGLVGGVSNDAVNFLNSAIGSKAASRKVIFTIASVGILLGTMTSSGMMEVARSGVFYPEMFTFRDVMMLFLGVMFANVILLDLFNTFGLPTSTTVSLVFGLLGAAVAVTSLKLPLSTTYVTFMVAMGSSLADKAWGRESAVYRITGVVTVIAGWFVTALIAFVIALVVTYALLWGGTWAVIIISLLCVGMFIQSSITHKRRKAKEHKTEEIVTASGNSTQEVMRNLIAEISGVMTKTTEIYSKTIMATLNEDRRTLREMVRESNDLFYNAREKKYALLPTLQKLQDNYIEAGHFYVQVVDYISEMSKALVHITRPCFEHIDNNHKGMSEEQVEDLLKINDKVSEIYARINVMLNDNDYSDTNVVLEMRDELFVTIDDAVKSQLRRIQNKATSTKASMLYLTILNETKTMVLQSRNLLKSQRSFMENQDTSNDLMGNK